MPVKDYYAAALAAARMHIVVALADEVAATKRQKRQRTADKRTGRWLRKLTRYQNIIIVSYHTLQYNERLSLVDLRRRAGADEPS